MRFKNYLYPEDFYFANNQIILTKLGRFKSAKYRKKITGSRIAAVLGRNEYTSQFQIWCEILGFTESEIEPYFARAGTVIEKVLLEYAKKELNKNFKAHDSKEIGYDAFQEHEIFGGIPDGEEYVGKKVQSIIEIKTTPIDSYCYTFKENELRLIKDGDGIPRVRERNGNIHKWFSFSENEIKVPEEYQYQLALYLYLRQIEKGYFCIGFLNTQHYLKPESYTPRPKSELGKTNPQMIVIEEMNIDLEKFSRVMEEAENWYKQHIIKGISPQMSPQDLNWIRFGFPAL